MPNHQIIEYNHIRVLTTQQLAESYQSNSDTITKNFNRNKDRYIPGEHYICLKGDELKEFRATRQIDLLPNINTLYLWTQKGTLLHAKSLNTDVAWEVYGRLVDNYFSKSSPIDISQLSPELQMFKQIWDMQARQELETKRIAAEQKQLKETIENQGRAIQTVKDTFSKQSPKDFRPWVKQCITAISESPAYQFTGTKPEKYQAVTKESYDRLNQKKPCRLKQRVESERGRALSSGASAARVNAINKLTIIENDKALKPIYETVLKEMMIAYCTYERKEV